MNVVLEQTADRVVDAMIGLTAIAAGLTSTHIIGSARAGSEAMTGGQHSFNTFARISIMSPRGHSPLPVIERDSLEPKWNLMSSNRNYPRVFTTSGRGMKVMRG